MTISSINPLSQSSPLQPQNDARQPAANIAAANQSVIGAVAASPDAVQAPTPKQQAAAVEDAVKKLNETVQSMQPKVGIEFSVDDDTQLSVVKVVDTHSKEVIRQIPTQEALNIAKTIDKLQGLLVRDKA
ncbi:flagellar protein FlaG [Jeongeupia naejangsanensis]|uniref:Flagellar protein FlaG n=1 Tax=Jeongeupia naejangsanensis TaxID=613195 RepID=A0ABS2BF01_9NEIS|nr:flagellar protein FlaG [Jeongeupia naejangsanensis]MBM3114207.1 flagellar protein FlaG [Jeongeupia naejangsanensis]